MLRWIALCAALAPLAGCDMPNADNLRVVTVGERFERAELRLCGEVRLMTRRQDGFSAYATPTRTCHGEVRLVRRTGTPVSCPFFASAGAEVWQRIEVRGGVCTDHDLNDP